MVGYKNEEAENWKEHANTLNRTPMKAAKIWIALNHMPGGDDSCWGGADGQLDELESGDDSGLDDKALLDEFNEPEPVEASAQPDIKPRPPPALVRSKPIRLSYFPSGERALWAKCDSSALALGVLGDLALSTWALGLVLCCIAQTTSRTTKHLTWAKYALCVYLLCCFGGSANWAPAHVDGR